MATELARILRKNQTATERILWNSLRNRQFLGKKFLRQHPIFFDYEGKEAFFIADFHCHEHRLVIEVDGKSHDYQKEYDDYRTYIINCLGIKVVRFTNEEIEDRLGLVLQKIRGIVLASGLNPLTQ
ncbi:MAG: endonuclease domain-containing protein [Bacteroidota bacterium]